MGVDRDRPVPTLRCEPMGEHFTKFHLEGLPVAAVLHRFTAAEPDADPHDHPWGFTSFVLFGGYVEEIFRPGGARHTITRRPGASFYVQASRIHRVIRLLDEECWTLILPGPPERVSGFYRWAEDGSALYRPWNRPDFQPLKGDTECH